MKNTTAPGVQPDGHLTSLPVVGFTQWCSLARSPLGGVPAGGLPLGRVEAAGGRVYPSGGTTVLVGQLGMVTLALPVPVSVQ